MHLCKSLGVRLGSLCSRHCRQPYVWLLAILLCASSYLCLSNLDYALLWYDEANTALISNNFLNTGTLTAWDGRNLASDKDGMNLNSKAHEVLPPLMYVISAASIKLFGMNEIGARGMHAGIGVLALLMFLLLLRQHLPSNSRLLFLIFLLVCLSPQLLLYFRQARYYAFSVFAFIACFYFYEQYWRSGRLVHFIAMTLLGLLAFFNHYSIGAASVLTIALFHLITRSPTTTKKQWLLFACVTLFIALAGSAYLYQAGFLTADNQMLHYFSLQRTFTFTDHIWKLFTALKTVIACGWLSWIVCLLFLLQWKANTNKIDLRSQDYGEAHRLILIGILFFVLSVILSPQKQNFNAVIETRYSVAALPFLLVMKGVFIDQLMRRSRLLAAIALVVLLFTSVGAYPFNIQNFNTGKSTLGFHLLSFIREIHRPYRPDATEQVANYLREHADQDNLVYVNKFAQRLNLTYYAGDHVLLCCQIDLDNERLAAKVASMRSSLFFDQSAPPDWIIIFDPKHDKTWNRFAKHQYHRNWTLVHFPMFADDTQRPEIFMHTFDPYLKPTDGGVYLLRRKPQASATWF